MLQNFSYQDALRASERIDWRVEDLIGTGSKLDFSKPFLPERLAGVSSLDFLSPRERIVCNQIRGHGYLCMFGLAEEFILPFVLDHLRPQLGVDDFRTRALLEFAAEEAKHIHLFKEFRAAFDAGFGVPCEFVGPPEAVRAQVLAHQPLAVAITILHIEWMTQRHYLDSVRSDLELDPLFVSLLKHHWMEEAGHAKLDTLMVHAYASGLDRHAVALAIDDYLKIGGLLDGLLRQQVEFDIASLQRAIGRTLTEAEKSQARAAQTKANRWTFLGSGMSHPNLLATLEFILPGSRTRIEQTAQAVS